jgi:hypothetical protein
MKKEDVDNHWNKTESMKEFERWSEDSNRARSRRGTSDERRIDINKSVIEGIQTKQSLDGVNMIDF